MNSPRQNTQNPWMRDYLSPSLNNVFKVLQIALVSIWLIRLPAFKKSHSSHAGVKRVTRGREEQVEFIFFSGTPCRDMFDL